MLFKPWLYMVRIGTLLTMFLIGLIIVLCYPAKSYGQLTNDTTKFLGNVIRSSTIPDRFTIYWDQVTPENSSKWGSVAYSADTTSWSWATLDNIYKYAVDHSFPFKFHTLVWGQQQPSWITNLDSAQQAKMVEAWIRLSGERYPKASFVDVVNEPLHAPPPYINAIGGSGTTGWDWVIWTFQKAREYFPNSKLLINDYNILSSVRSTQTYIGIIDTLKARNLIDGIGCQGHFLESTDTSIIRMNLDQLAATGLPIYISEYDVNISDDTAQLNIYKKQFPLFWNHPDVKGITFWGYIEYQIWRTNAYLLTDRLVERPAMVWLRQYLSQPTAVKDNNYNPIDYTLSQNYPNPFNPTTTINYELPSNAKVVLKIYDDLGRKVTTLVNCEQSAGSHRALFDGSHLTSGVYFYRISAGNFTQVKKMILIK